MSTKRQLAYEPLPQVEGSIRLLSVQRDIQNDMICCNLAEGNTNQRYNTLFYTWGSPSETRLVLVNGQKVSIRHNLWEFLNVAWQYYPEKSFWIDAICINQDDIAERNSQVQIMGSIYKSSQKTLIWLGPTASRSSESNEPPSHVPFKSSLQNIDHQFVKLTEKMVIYFSNVRQLCLRAFAKS